MGTSFQDVASLPLQVSSYTTLKNAAEVKVTGLPHVIKQVVGANNVCSL